ncbi:MAG: ParA family protein [Deltaproteobacteria bacterium]|nr:ParA family protein [Candidatus Anaeroferrophillacea bacterium]
MQVIAVSNRKGGTGKTTVSVNLAAELALLGRRVLLIDLDSQGHCAVGLGVKVAAGEATAHRLFVDPAATLGAAFRDTEVPNLWLAPADPGFDHGSGERDDRRLRDAIEREHLAERFDVIVIDTPPSLDALLVNGLMAATRVLVPYVPHHLSFEGVRQLTRVLFKIMTGENRGLKIIGFLPTMAATHIRQHRTVTGQVAWEFGAKRVLPGIRNDIRLAESFAAGRPIRLYSPHCRGAEDFLSLARGIADHFGTPTP